MAIDGISSVGNIPQIASIGNIMGGSNVDGASNVEGASNTTGLDSFKKVFANALDEVNKSQLESSAITNDFAAGKNDNIHQVMIAAEKADVALQFTMQIRNKVMDAYNEIMRMQI